MLEDHEDPSQSSAAAAAAAANALVADLQEKLKRATADANAVVADLQEKLKRATADADRHAAEKAEVLRMADSTSRERDELSVRADALGAERDRLLAEAETLKSALSQATAHVEEALAEAGRLAKELASQNPTDSLEVIWGVVRKETKAGVAFLRSKIPEGHPAQKWFDLAVEWSLAFGCFAFESTVAFVKWATPVAKELSTKGLAEIERRLAKK
ncbi:MAG TPA: hypothetical protein VMJ31_07855 [Methylocystis sp.]|nr:hypothetical protein [Methylocystis sp.]